MVYNGYYKVMSNIPKMGHLPTPVNCNSSTNNQRNILVISTTLSPLMACAGLMTWKVYNDTHRYSAETKHVSRFSCVFRRPQCKHVTNTGHWCFSSSKILFFPVQAELNRNMRCLLSNLWLFSQASAMLSAPLWGTQSLPNIEMGVSENREHP